MSSVNLNIQFWNIYQSEFVEVTMKPTLEMASPQNNAKRSKLIPVILISWPLLLQSTYGTVAAQTVASSQDSTSQQVDASDVLTGNTAEAKLRILHKFEFLEGTSSAISSGASATDLDFEIPSNPNITMFLQPDELQEIFPGGPDPLGAELRRRFSDVPHTVPLNQLIKGLVDSFESKTKRSPGSEIAIPTDLEIDILNDLWAQETATASDIYARLDTIWHITSEDLRGILEQMAQHGFLERKQISPSHPFSLFGLAQIEISSKNRKNRVYLYWPVIPKDELITYIDAKRYLAYANHQEQGGDGQTDADYHLLERKLIRLLE